MKHILFFLSIIGLAACACTSSKKAKSSLIKQGITGRVTELTGNQMPMKGREPDIPKGVLTNVLIYEPTHISQVTRLGTSGVYTSIQTKMVASVETDSTGSFSIALPEGAYSLFIEQGKQYYSNLYDTAYNIALFKVEKGKLTTARLSISSKATY